MSVDERLSQTRAQFAAISREYEERRGLRERDLAELQAAVAEEQEKSAASFRASVAELEKNAVEQEEQTDASGWQRRSQDHAERLSFGFEEDEQELADDRTFAQPQQSTGVASRPPALEYTDDDDFSNNSWLS